MTKDERGAPMPDRIDSLNGHKPKLIDAGMEVAFGATTESRRDLGHDPNRAVGPNVLQEVATVRRQRDEGLVAVDDGARTVQENCQVGGDTRFVIARKVRDRHGPDQGQGRENQQQVPAAPA